MLERRHAIAALLANRRDDLLIVSGLGSPTYDVASVKDDDRNFHLWGAMGGAAMVGLGIALARPNRRVAVITGDGETLMGLGALATVGVQKPANLAIVVFDNGLYGETGSQPSHTNGTVDLVQAAAACGIGFTMDVNDDAGLARLAGLLATFTQTLFARVAITPTEPPRVLPSRDGVALKLRFRAAAGSARA
jgi:thiamine pyrophosphate-dependent acetolactate synthase large subunit-like protein